MPLSYSGILFVIHVDKYYCIKTLCQHGERVSATYARVGATELCYIRNDLCGYEKTRKTFTPRQRENWKIRITFSVKRFYCKFGFSSPPQIYSNVREYRKANKTCAPETRNRFHLNGVREIQPWRIEIARHILQKYTKLCIHIWFYYLCIWYA